jgi:uncharacterized Zn finger protein
MPTCPTCHKESHQPEKREDLSHKLLRAVGIGHFRCAYCGDFYFASPWHVRQWFMALSSARQAAPVVRQCPQCGDSKTHRSHRHGVVEHVVSVFRIYPYRCEACGQRFFALKR